MEGLERFYARQLSLATDAVVTVHQLANIGQADAPDVLQAEVEAEQAKADYATAQRDYIQAFQSLADKPRVFITESTSARLSGDASAGEVKGSLAFTGGTSPQNVVIKAFSRNCRDAVITANREKADYIVRLDHEPISPTTPFVHGNKVAVFDKNEDMIYSNSTRLLGSSVKGACDAITNGPAGKR